MGGRHSSQSQWRFYTSVAGYFLPWALVAVVAVGAAWAGVRALGDDELQTSPRAARPQGERPGPDRSVDTVVSPAPRITNTAAPTQPSDRSVELITAGMTIQVLNGSSDAGADDLMADRLARLGFDVISIAGASRAYEETTVLWSYAESVDAAEALGARFGWRVAPKPDNLSTQVAIHVVVGADEAASP